MPSDSKSEGFQSHQVWHNVVMLNSLFYRSHVRLTSAIKKQIAGIHACSVFGSAEFKLRAFILDKEHTIARCLRQCH